MHIKFCYAYQKDNNFKLGKTLINLVPNNFAVFLLKLAHPTNFSHCRDTGTKLEGSFFNQNTLYLDLQNLFRSTS